MLLMNITKTFGLKVRYFRKLKSLTQEELASMSDLHRTYIGSIERGERNITLLNADRIAHALNEPIVSFFEETTDE